MTESHLNRPIQTRVPNAMYDALKDDAQTLGIGARAVGGTQGVLMYAFALYLALPRDQRRALAMQAIGRGTSTYPEIMSGLSETWPIRTLQAMGGLEADEREALIADLEAQVKRQRRGRRRS